MSAMRRAVTVFVLAAAAVTPALAVAQKNPADMPDKAITDGSAQQALDAAKARWKKAKIRSYDFRVRHSCFCAPDYTKERVVKVRNGVPAKRTASQVKDIATVARLFGKVQGAIDGKVTNLDVTYDARYGYPRNIYIDQSIMIADEEQGYGARGLKKRP